MNSGDRAYRADGEIYVTGRVKDIIIKGGRNLYPHEVEELATRAEGIRKGCVVAFGLNDEASGTEKLVVVAETRERDAARRAAIAAKVTEQVSQGLGLPPDRVELIPPGSIPKTSSGKLRREETKQLYLAGTLAAGRAPAWVQIARLGATSGVPALDCANVGHPASHPGSSRSRALHLFGAENFIRADRMQSASCWKAICGCSRREGFCVQPRQLFRRVGADAGPGSALPFRSEDGSARNAVHRRLFGPHGPFEIQSHGSGVAVKAG